MSDLFYPSRADLSSIQQKGCHVALIDWNHSIPKELVCLPGLEVLRYQDK
jgi:hypothetical protein